MALETRVGYRENRADMAKLLMSDQTRGPAVEAARVIAAVARENARRSKGPGPHLADSYKVNERGTPWVSKEHGNPHATAEVYSENEAAAPNEFGNATFRRPNRPLGRAGAEVGEMRGEPG